MAPTRSRPALAAEWYGINQYLFYTVNDCWKAGSPLGMVPRRRWRPRHRPAESEQRDLRPVASPATSTRSLLGLNWTPSANLTVRPEMRYDWYDGVALGPATGPFNAGTDDSQFLLGVDAIYLW